jgi:hypothetical protein
VNGTVTDSVTGLVWLQQANCLAFGNWTFANQAVAGLKHGDCGLTDGSSPGDWRLPTREEWEATILQPKILGCGQHPEITNDAGTGCYGDGTKTSFTGVFQISYWSSTSSMTNPTFGYVALLAGAEIFGGALKSTANVGVWPVRGGPLAKKVPPFTVIDGHDPAFIDGPFD